MSVQVEHWFADSETEQQLLMLVPQPSRGQLQKGGVVVWWLTPKTKFQDSLCPY